MITVFLKLHTEYVEKGRVTDKIEYLTANIEDNYSIAQANAELDDNGNFIKSLDPLS